MKRKDDRRLTTDDEGRAPHAAFELLSSVVHRLSSMVRGPSSPIVLAVGL